jgi:hypothetical protein
LLWPLDTTQRQCVRQITDSGSLVYVEKQTDEDYIAIGYLVDDDYFVSIFNVDQSDHCNIEFQERVWNCYEQVLGVYCNRYGYSIKPERIQRVELTDNEFPEVYVWFDALGPGKVSNAYHVFYTRQMDSSFEPVLTLRLCVSLSSVEIDSDSMKIVVTNDLICDMFHDRKEVIECSLLHGTPQCEVIRHEEG